jgi:perosamine synthetase
MKNQKISWWNTEFNEKDVTNVSNAIRDRKMSMGSITHNFEKKLAKKLKVKYVIATSSGSSALLMSLMAIGIKKNDEVIIPNRTWIAAVNAVLILGGTPVIVDVEKNNPIMDVNLLEKFINSKTKAVIPTQLNGRAVDMERVWFLAKKYNIKVIEDSAQGLFSKHKGVFMGTLSDFGCFSMSVAKLLPTGQGGFIVTNHKQYYEILLKIRTHGVSNFTEFSPFETLGFNFRITDIISSIGITRLNEINGKIKNLKKIYKIYEKELKNFVNINIIPVDITKGEIPLYVEVVSKDNKKIIKHLKKNNIETRTLYPDLDTANYFQTSRNFPNSRIFGEHGFVLPCGPDQPLDNIYKVISVIKEMK